MDWWMCGSSMLNNSDRNQHSNSCGLWSFWTNVSPPHSADQVELCGRQWQKIWNFLENHKKFKFRLIIICGFIFIMFKLEWYLVKARLSRSSRRSHNNIFFLNQTPFHDDCFASLNWQAINQNYVLCWSHELFDVFFFFGDLCSSLCASLRSIISLRPKFWWCVNEFFRDEIFLTCWL